MNSLFVKILLWFWATLVITTIGSAFISGLPGPHPYLLSRLVAFQLAEARAAYEVRWAARVLSSSCNASTRYS